MMTEDDLRALPRLSSFFPIVFRTGARWNRLSGECGKCGRAIEDRDLRGEVAHPFPSVFVVSATGYCRVCRLLTPFSYRLHEDMAMTGIDRRTGEWARWEARPTTLRGKLRKWLRSRSLGS